MSSGTILGTVDRATELITVASRHRQWRVDIYRRSKHRVLVCLTDERWQGLICVQTEGPARVVVRTKRTGFAATVVLVIVTILGLVLCAGTYYALLLTGAMHPGSVEKGSLATLGYLVVFLFALLPARLIWLRRPSRVEHNRELDRMVDALIADAGSGRLNELELGG